MSYLNELVMLSVLINNHYEGRRKPRVLRISADTHGDNFKQFWLSEEQTSDLVKTFTLGE